MLNWVSALFSHFSAPAAISGGGNSFVLLEQPGQGGMMFVTDLFGNLDQREVSVLKQFPGLVQTQFLQVSG